MGRFSKLETGSAPTPEPEGKHEDGTTYGTQPVTYESVFRQAEEQFYQGEWKKALRAYSQALQMDSQRLDPWAGQVMSLLMQGQTSEAGVWAQRGITNFPDHPTLIALHGLVLAMQGMVSRGMGTSDFAMAKGALDPITWIARGWILLQADNSNWEFCFSKVDEIATRDNWKILAIKGFILERYKKWSFALDNYRRSIEISPGNFYVWHRMGVVCAKLGLTNRAYEAQEHALELNHHYPPAERELRSVAGLSIGGIFARIRGLFTSKPSQAGAKKTNDLP